MRQGRTGRGTGRHKRKRCGKLFNHRPQGRRNEPPAEKRSEIAHLLRRGLPAARVILPKRCDSKHLLGAILDNVELDSIIYSDGWKAYNKLSLNGFHHKRINHEKALANGEVRVNGLENVRGYA
jgi:transposase